MNWLFNVTFNDISVIYVTAHICAGGLKKNLNLRPGSHHHRHFVGFFNVPVQTTKYPLPLPVISSAVISVKGLTMDRDIEENISVCRIELVAQFPARGLTLKSYYTLNLVFCGCDTIN